MIICFVSAFLNRFYKAEFDTLTKNRILALINPDRFKCISIRLKIIIAHRALKWLASAAGFLPCRERFGGWSWSLAARFSLL
jgi:hypothetical protein